MRTGQTAITDSIEALDDRSRDAIETLTTGAAREIAAFLYDRDQDLLQAATLDPDETAYANFLATHQRLLEDHAPYVPDADGERWIEQEPSARNLDLVRAPHPDNAANFQQLFAWYAEGKVKPLVSQVFALEQAAEAINALGQRKAVGKVVVQVR